MQGRLPGEFDSVSLPGKVAYLFSGCWSIHPEERPTMATVAATLLNTVRSFSSGLKCLLTSASKPDERYIHTSGRMQNRVVITRGARANIERGLFVFGDGLTQIVAVKTYQENLVRVVNAQAPKCWDVSWFKNRSQFSRSTQYVIQVLSDEASEWRLLKHDNLVPVWGFLHEPSPALIYPWYDNGDLGSYLLSNPHLEISEKLTLVSLRCAAYMWTTEPEACGSCDKLPTDLLISINKYPPSFTAISTSTTYFLTHPETLPFLDVTSLSKMRYLERMKRPPFSSPNLTRRKS